MNLRRVLHVIGMLVVTISLTMLAPLAVAVGYWEVDAIQAFVVAIVVGLVVGGIPAFVWRQAPDSFYRREGLTVVGLAWLVCALIGCLPYVLTSVIPDFVGAYFETMSGFTTTGASVMPSMETYGAGLTMPRSILFWRCMTNWLGGVGIVVLLVALLPALGVGSRIMFHFEVPGVGEKGFKPQIRQTAKTLWTIYAAFTLVESLLLMLAGMDWFSALCHSFATMATGGFSVHTASIGFYNSTWIHIIITVFMFFAGINFTLYHRLAGGQWRNFFRDTEFRVYSGVMAAVIALISLNLYLTGTETSFGTAVRDSAFQVVSIGTTTGFATTDYDLWPSFSKVLLCICMFIGGSAGSTAGGLKMIRVILILKFMASQLRRHVRPRSVTPVRLGGNPILEELLQPILGVGLLFIFTFVLGGICLSALGVEMDTAFAASIATLGNIGPGFAGVGPTCNYAEIPDAGKFVCSLLMLIGRLEIMTALSLLTTVLWRD
ncbi:MAG: trk system potassium uptake protein TrkH [Planctomycetota bacterium]|jgi:trk system potassium uptake protein TrkH